MQVSWRIVIDPNVLVSAAISPAGSPAVLLTLIDAGAITAILSPRLLAELGGVLRRGRFRAWLDLDEVTAYLDELERLAEAVDDPAEVPIVSPDPDDDYLIALARTTNADAVVSGDTDLTGLALADLPTLTPRQLLDELAAARDDPTLGSDQTYVGAVPDEPKEYRMAIPADALAHRRDTHAPWITRRNRGGGSCAYREEWSAQQCGACSFYVPLAGGYGMDWGACTNDRSVFDGRVMFEHDGCEEHSPAEEWVSAYDIEDLLGDT